MILSNFPTKTITPESIGAIPNPSGGTTGQVLTKTSTGEEWSDAPNGLPEGGTEGQVLKRGASGAEWGDAEWLPLSGGTLTGRLTIPELWGKSPDSSLPFFSMDASSGSINIPMVYSREPSSSQEIANKQYVDNAEVNLSKAKGTLSIANGGTGVTSMTGTDYSANRPRGIVLQNSTPSSVPNGCIVGVYE